jgi:anthranilate phosphoribosyltransferase
MSDAAAPLQRAVRALADHESLSEDLAAAVFAAVMRGEASPVQVAALLLGLRVKGETPEEVAGVATALRDAMVRVPADPTHLVDTCGTGGGTISTFNISTAAAFVVAAAGGRVAKHGNRSFTSKCGSADVLEALGVRIVLEPAAAARVLEQARITFLFAPNYHPAMKHVGPVRRELGVPSVMNLVGPLANPAGVTRQVLGVADRDRGPLLAGALLRLGAKHAMVVHGRAGLDEISPQGITDVWEVRDGQIQAWELDPAPLALEVADLGLLRGGEPPENAQRVERVLENGKGDAAGAAAVTLNAGAALYVAGLAGTYKEGVALARETLAGGKARERLETLRRVSTSE